MKVVIQRSKYSYVEVEGKKLAEIHHGLVLLVCFEREDTKEVLQAAAQKILALRTFADESGKMNLNIKQVTGEILAISQFTLSWSGKKGNRPSFDASAPPERARGFFEEFVTVLRQDVPVKMGVFGADMLVAIQNDGPVTFHLSF